MNEEWTRFEIIYTNALLHMVASVDDATRMHIHVSLLNTSLYVLFKKILWTHFVVNIVHSKRIYLNKIKLKLQHSTV